MVTLNVLRLSYILKLRVNHIIILFFSVCFVEEEVAVNYQQMSTAGKNRNPHSVKNMNFPRGWPPLVAGSTVSNLL